ncbi:MAG TPA: hypothetical protein VK181_07170 [Rhizobium sp.]|nr:hypothetical protein [Rhizobium sp.]
MTRKIKNFDDYYISYNPDAGGDPLSVLCAALTGFDKGGEETAVMHGDEQLILNGDHFEALCAAGSIEACREYFDNHIAAQSPWTVGRERKLM